MIIGVDIGGSKTLVASFDDNGEILASSKFKTNKNLDEFLPTLIKKVTDYASRPAYIAIAAPGRIDYGTGVIRALGNLGWKNLDLISLIQEAFPEARVVMDNDANVGALNQSDHNPTEGKQVYLTLSTGIGMGFTSNGVLTPELQPAEVGHVLFKQDGDLVSWEQIASGKAFYETYGQYGADVDDPKIWAEWAANVFLGLVMIQVILHPDVIAIGGSMGTHFDKYKDHLLTLTESSAPKMARDMKIVQAFTPEEAVIRGCYHLANHESASR